jgi:predicted acylesterase/phospholipase RssA
MLTIDLALQGGGSKGIALNAAIAELMRRGHTIRRVVGTSAGAIAASLVATGFTADELLEMSLGRTEDDQPLFSEYVVEPVVSASPEVDVEVSKVHSAALHLPGELGQRLLVTRAALAFFDSGGLNTGDGFTGWLLRTLEQKSPGLSRITLGQLHARTGRHLTLIATDLTARRLRALNHLSAPDCPLVMAVRMSMSIPLLFAEVVWRAEWGTYLGQPLAGHALVDGGVLSNLPMSFILPTANPLVATLMGPPPEGAAIPVGLVLDTMLEVPGAPPEPESRVAQTRLGHRLGALMDTVINGADLSLADASPVPVCHLPAKGYSATEFSMTQRRAQALVDAATNVARRYFDALEATHRPR